MIMPHKNDRDLCAHERIPRGNRKCGNESTPNKLILLVVNKKEKFSAAHSNGCGDYLNGNTSPMSMADNDWSPIRLLNCSTRNRIRASSPNGPTAALMYSNSVESCPNEVHPDGSKT